MTNPDATPQPRRRRTSRPPDGSGGSFPERPPQTEHSGRHGPPPRQNAAEKRKNSERRRLIDPTTCERDYNDDETEFMKAMDRYKRENRRPFPTWSEVLEVLRSLGYRRVAEADRLPGGKTEKDSGVDATPAAARGCAAKG